MDGVLRSVKTQALEFMSVQEQKSKVEWRLSWK